MSRSAAAIVTDMLQGVVKEGTAKKALALKRPIAGKTGTTNEYKDALFIGFSPSIAAGVWVGKDNFTTLGEKETGSKAALPIWIQFMREALQERPNEYFDIPDDIVQIHIHPSTGMLEPDTSPSGVKALFEKGTEFRQQNE